MQEPSDSGPILLWVAAERDDGHLHLAPQVDVEGGELEVLRGASEKTLSKIRQIVLEVHDVDGRVTEVHQLLERKGFAILGTEKGVCHTKLVFAARKQQ